MTTAPAKQLLVRSTLTAVAASAVALLVSSPFASAGAVQGPPRPSFADHSVIEVTGQVMPGVETGCLVLVDDHDVKYLLLEDDPALKNVPVPWEEYGSPVTVTGELDKEVATICMEGTPIHVRSVKGS